MELVEVCAVRGCMVATQHTDRNTALNISTTFLKESKDLINKLFYEFVIFSHNNPL
jgi:hypothetical protein